MSDSRQDLRDKLRQTGCEVVIPQAVVPVIPTRPAVPCDPVTGEPLPNIFVTPGGVTPIDDLPPTLDLISIGNDTQTKTCVDLPDKNLAYPDTKTVEANTVQLSFSWYDIVPAITDAQIFYLYTLYADLPELLAKLIDTSTNAVGNLAAYTKLTDQQAASANDLAKNLKASANDQASQLALLQLVCGWYNETQTVYCPSGALTTGAIAGVDSLNPSTISAGTVFSTESLGTANTNAYGLATAALKCVYGNDEQTQSCTDLFPSEPPVDSLPAESTNTKAANTYFSTVNKAEANALALAAAREALNCYWKNDAQEIVCAPDADSIPAILSDTPIYDPNNSQLSTEYPDGLFPQGNVTDGTVGNKVLVAADLFSSNTSFADAQLLAESAGENLLLCRWGNDVVKAQCPIVEIEDPNRKGLLDNTQVPPTAYKLQVLPNLALSQPLITVNDFFRAKSLTNITVALGSRSFNITSWNPSVTVQFAVGDLVSIKPINGTDSVIEGVILTGEITGYAGAALIVNVLQLAGNALTVLGSATWNKWQITLAQGSVIIDNSILSDVSKDDANIIAQSIVDSSLRCIYCNVQVDPRCLPLQLTKNYNGELVMYDPADIPNPTGATIWDSLNWNIVGGQRQPTLLNLVWQVDSNGVPKVDEYGFKIPLYTGNTVIDPGLIKDPQFAWSDDATLGVAAGKFCGEVVPIVQEIADNQLPVSFYREKEDACIYCNEAVGADCVNGALIRAEDPLDGSVFLPTRTVCVANAPVNYQRKKYLITDDVVITLTNNLSGTFTQGNPLLFVYSSPIDFDALNVEVGDYLNISGTLKTRYSILTKNSLTKTLTLDNPDNIIAPTTPVLTFVSKKLKGTLQLVSGVLKATITTIGFNNANYSYILNSDYLKLLGSPDRDFVINGKSNPNLLTLLNPEGYTIPVGEQFLELWHADTTNKPLAQQYATDIALDLAAAALACVTFVINCSQTVTVTCASIGKGTPASNLDPAGPTQVTLPKCFFSDADTSPETLTQQARDVAKDILNCAFFNDKTTVPCQPPWYTAPENYGQWLVNVGGIVEKKVFLDSNYETVRKSAGALAENLANTGSCIWTNSSKTYTCNNLDLAISCPVANRAMPNVSVTFQPGTLIQILNDLSFDHLSAIPVLEDLNTQLRDLARGILVPICEFCGNSQQIKQELICGGNDVNVNFNQNVSANTFFASTQAAANAAAQLLSQGHANCLSFPFVTQEEFFFLKLKINQALSAADGQDTALLGYITAVNNAVKGLDVTCTDGELEVVYLAPLIPPSLPGGGIPQV